MQSRRVLCNRVVCYAIASCAMQSRCVLCNRVVFCSEQRDIPELNIKISGRKFRRLAS